jgi:hypothetical protein
MLPRAPSHDRKTGDLYEAKLEQRAGGPNSGERCPTPSRLYNAGNGAPQVQGRQVERFWRGSPQQASRPAAQKPLDQRDAREQGEQAQQAPQ